MNGTEYNGVYEIELEADETVTINKKTYNKNSLDSENNHAKRFKRSITYSSPSNEPAEKKNKSSSFINLLILKFLIGFLVVSIRLCCCREKDSEDDHEIIIKDGPFIQESDVPADSKKCIL